MAEYPRLSEEVIKAALKTVDAGPFGVSCHYFKQTGSTNDHARALANAGAPEGTLVITDEQIAGRGRYTRTWVAPRNTSLLMSLVFRPEIPPTEAHRLVMACGLAIADACERELSAPVEVKWPNDLLIVGRKFTGILPESAFSGDQLEWVVVGMGINVNQVFEPEDPLYGLATSLREASGRVIDRAELLADILAGIRRWYALLAANMLEETWRGRCSTLGQSVRAEVEGSIIEGVALDITSNGALWIREAGGERHLITAGEATIVKPGQEGQHPGHQHT